MTCIDSYKEYMEASSIIAEAMKRKDHESLIEEYTKARKFAEEAKELAPRHLPPLPRRQAEEP